MADLVQQFCDYYHPYHDISPARRTAQARVLRELLDSVAPGELTADHLRRYLATLITEQHLKPSTVGFRLKLIRPFVGWLWEQKIIDGDRLMELKNVKPPRGSNGNGKPRPYSRKEIKAMWERLEAAYPWCRHVPARMKPTPEKLRDRGVMFIGRWRNDQSGWARVQPYAERLQVEAVIAVALYGGARREEIYRLELDAMHHDNAYVVIQGARKNPEAEQHARAVPMQRAMAVAIANWLDFRESLSPPHDRPWLSLHTEAHYLKPMRWRRFQGLLRPIGVEYHRLRHTFATESLRAGMELETLRDIMGHSRIQQTLAYAQLLEGDVVKRSARVAADFERAVGRA